ncbi:hypothetical protein PCANC_09721 [Puccinia coronata f. sp. avenae]|uniref:Uncharacterized protein n=1 Tax=Puccinia coronata f. sp. avenae TaxID=200324 RepID=A0A2N5V7J1_9BASI|nr:hypothetical protein PCANC_09721 [Puccinia coronata f. sp. avenae]
MYRVTDFGSAVATIALQQSADRIRPVRCQRSAGRTDQFNRLGPQESRLKSGLRLSLEYTTARFPEFARVRSLAQSRPGLPLPACPGFDGAGSSTSGRGLPDEGRASVTQRLEKHDNVGSSSEQANDVASLGTLSNRLTSTQRQPHFL